jgi:hypothetical protein
VDETKRSHRRDDIHGDIRRSRARS